LNSIGSCQDDHYDDSQTTNLTVILLVSSLSTSKGTESKNIEFTGNSTKPYEQIEKNTQKTPKKLYKTCKNPHTMPQFGTLTPYIFVSLI